DIHDIDSAVVACQRALAMGPKIVLVKHVHGTSKRDFTMLLACDKGVFMVTRPLIDVIRQPVGVGDLITSLFTGHYLHSFDAVRAFELCNNAVYSVLTETAHRQQWELQIIHAQEALASTAKPLFSARPLNINKLAEAI
ncbi:hypothetical protein J2R62_18655, partial [Plesiomonas shigelloides]|nr:hypothetical protein [Plesiomonas shigelloides]